MELLLHGVKQQTSKQVFVQFDQSVVISYLSTDDAPWLSLDIFFSSQLLIENTFWNQREIKIPEINLVSKKPCIREASLTREVLCSSTPSYGREIFSSFCRTHGSTILKSFPQAKYLTDTISGTVSPDRQPYRGDYCADLLQ